MHSYGSKLFDYKWLAYLCLKPLVWGTRPFETSSAAKEQKIAAGHRISFLPFQSPAVPIKTKKKEDERQVGSLDQRFLASRFH